MSAQPDPREAPPATANVASRDGNEWSRAKTRNMAVEDVEDIHNAVTPNPDGADDAAGAVAVAVAPSAAAASAAAAAATPGEAAITERREGSNAHPKPVRDAERDEAKAARVAARDEAKAVRDHARADRDQAKTDRNEAKAALRRGREDAEHSDRAQATARASTADILVPSRRPVWLVPVLAGAALLLVFLIVMKLRGGDRPTHVNAKSQPTQAQQVNEPARTPPAHQVGTAADQAAKDQAAKDQAAKDQAAKDQAAKDQAAKDQAAKDQAAKDQAAKDQAAKDQAANDQAAKDQAAKDQAAKDQATKDQAAKDQAAKDRNANKDQVAKKDPIVKKDPVEKKEPAPKKGIEELFAAGDFANTNTACTKEIVFTPQKLQMCAEAACQTKNTALAKRWINAISKASRPDMIAKCKGMGVDLEPAPAPAPAPAAPAPAAPPANESPAPPPTQ
jgi:hypothetical protein